MSGMFGGVWSIDWHDCNDIHPGSSCSATLKKTELLNSNEGISECVDTSESVKFCCPEDATPFHKLFVCSEYLKCKVCGFDDFEDKSEGTGHIQGTLYFGPNTKDGLIDESMVSGYKVFLAGDCGQPLSYEPVGTMKLTEQNRAKNTKINHCCIRKQYALDLSANTSGASSLVLYPTSVKIKGKSRLESLRAEKIMFGGQVIPFIDLTTTTTTRYVPAGAQNWEWLFLVVAVIVVLVGVVYWWFREHPNPRGNHVRGLELTQRT